MSSVAHTILALAASLISFRRPPFGVALRSLMRRPGANADRRRNHAGDTRDDRKFRCSSTASGPRRRPARRRSPQPGHRRGDRQAPHASRRPRPRARGRRARASTLWRKISAVRALASSCARPPTCCASAPTTIARVMTHGAGQAARRGAGRDAWPAADIIDWFAEEGRRAYGRVMPARAEGVYQLVVKEPVGPVAAFTPWNFPINQAVRKISAALAAGCSIIVKAPGGNAGLAAPRWCAPSSTPACRPASLSLVFGDAGRDLGLPDPAPDHPQDLLHRLDGGRQAARRARRAST